MMILFKVNTSLRNAGPVRYQNKQASGQRYIPYMVTLVFRYCTG